MAKFSVPQVRFTEIDNTVRVSGEPSDGVGAIVMKSNKGPVNQRILTSSYDEFTRIFGQPEELSDFGHFAAENYLANSNQLYAIRATMGDEQYAQIQYPYTDAEADYRYTSKDIASFKFINNEDASNLQLCDPLNRAVADVSTFASNNEYIIPGYTPNAGSLVNALAEGEETPPSDPPKGDSTPTDTTTTNSTFYAYQKANFVTINDLITDAAPSVAVFKVRGTANDIGDPSVSTISAADGVYVEFAQNVSRNGDVTKKFDDLIFTTNAWNNNTLNAAAFIIPSNVYTYNSTTSGKKLQFTVPADYTLNNSNVAVSMWVKTTITDKIEKDGGIKISELFNDNSFYKGTFENDSTKYCTSASALKLEYLDWDDMTTKTNYVKTDDVTGAVVGQAVGISYREYGMADNSEALVISKESSEGDYALRCDTIPNVIKNVDSKYGTGANAGEAAAKELANEYGLELADINNAKYSMLQYVEVWDGKIKGTTEAVSNHANGVRVTKLILTESFIDSDPECYNENLFWVYSKKDSNKISTVSVYTAKKPEPVVIPWQDGIIKQEASEDKKTAITKMIAMSTSEILNGTDGTYKDGYTLTMESDEEPGNGDVEKYLSNKENQLIITARDPGKWGNDIGVSIITTECESIPALNHQNAFCWKYKYDDEDLVNKDLADIDYTWKKVYRINVYIKTKNQTAEAAWGSGLDALLKDPVEYFLVSNDPQAKDGEGNSLYAPNVINGHSEYIYVSRNSVNDAMTGAGQYAQPMQTYGIYGLTGGANSKKNNMTEKTTALKLYADRQKSKFDVLFNVEAIDTFNGRQRYNAHQRRIAEIAAARTMDIGVVQVTSKQAKTVKQMLSEGKNFVFNNGSYVAAYAGYDKYFNSTLASWIYLPKSVAAACSIALCATRYYPWMAPAGTTRGTIDYTTNQLSRLSDDEIGQLYDANINTSRQSGAYGEVLWGQKTALKKESALNRINVRCCMNYLEKVLENMMVPYLFQQNTANTRSSAKNAIDSFLSRVKAADGIIDFASSVVADTDEHIMLVNITVKPAEAIEFIDVKITVTRDSVSMSAEETRQN